MSRIHPAAVRDLDELGPDAEDEALLEHVFGDGRPPQGLHRRGWRCPCGKPACDGERCLDGDDD